MRRYEPDEALAVIEQAEQWQEHFRATRGETFFHLGDEFYLMTGREVPPARHYDDFPQLEDGIGLTRAFLQDVTRLVRRGRDSSVVGLAGLIACGTLIGPTMRRAAARVSAASGCELAVTPIENTFFGGEINVSGLLTGSELTRVYADMPGTQPLFISGTMISRRTGAMLDDMTVDDLKSALRRDVIVADHLSDVVAALATSRAVVA